MFTLAQYVFGIGKPESLLNSDQTTNETLQSTASNYYEEDLLPKQCVQTNIENDWILIEVESKVDDDPNKVESKSTNNNGKNGAVKHARNRKVNNKSQRSSNVDSLTTTNTKSGKDDEWSVEPPECFTRNSGDDSIKTSSIENLLIEHPSMSVFDNLFIKRPSPITKVEPLKKECSKVATLAKKSNNNNGKENSNRSNNRKSKKSSTESIANANSTGTATTVLNVSNQGKEVLASVNTKIEQLHKKRTITKKNYERQNKVMAQRNGPIIRHKKMFTHLNGVCQHNRSRC
ncbi:hypothetical protein RDWZM_003916 [Blomia tropicalis]|uniref:Uncharacterized protein n=1 Tax=Blomia tropicalis TaxID=40697 RepID=A0A9Q0RTG6_BLOTA|nr:hypothetical protein RDWZM_003916 [Blomia tropicalis]